MQSSCASRESSPAGEDVGTIVSRNVFTATMRPGDHVVASVTDHNSVLRPFSALEADGEAMSGAHAGKGTQVTWTILEGDPLTGRVSAADVAALVPGRLLRKSVNDFTIASSFSCSVAASSRCGRARRRSV